LWKVRSGPVEANSVRVRLMMQRRAKQPFVNSYSSCMTSHGHPFHTPLTYASIAVKNRIAFESRTTLSVTVHPRLKDPCHPSGPVYVPPPAISSHIRPSPTESQTLIAHISSAKCANTPAQVQRTISRRLAASIALRELP
jgi:hypothetical protein